ncbi:caspase b-like isoform X2 [Osmerus eperlanus]|uniref:caspase b-like isoform X2 n=1 Tax=Osmerus eperlanus TaxID=29151 RepID=UPI002E122C85
MATFKLLKILEGLELKELKEFQWHLCQGADSFEAIPRGRMERLDRQDTVDLMVRKWPENAKAVTLEILRKMDQNGLAERLVVQSRA